MIEGPLSDAHVHGDVALPARIAQALLGVRQNDRRPGAEHPLHEASADLGDLLGLQGRGQIARRLVQRPRAPFAVHGHLGLVAQARHELGDHQGHRQHHHKGEQVLHVAHSQGKTRRHEEIIEARHAEESRQHRGAAPQAQRHAHHGQEEEHHDVGQLQPVTQGRGQQRDDHAHGGALRIGLPG